MKKVIYLLLFFICQYSFAQGSGEKIPIVAWGSVPETYTNDFQYNILKNAGINFSFSHFTSLEKAIKALDLAAKYNIKILLYCPELFSQTEKTVRKVKDHPGLGGYLLGDEPNVGRFDLILSWVKRIKSIDNINICYVNLFPLYASKKQLGDVSYQEYLNKFYSTFNLRVYSFDYYPITNGLVKKNWYENLEMISNMTKRKKSSFWGFVKVSSTERYSEIINLSDLKLQAFSNLAYGAQGIQFYRYWSIEGRMSDGPISIKGVKSQNYDKLSTLSQYIYNLQPIFLNCNVEKVYHTEYTRGASKLNNLSIPFLRLDNAKDLLVSKLTNGSKSYLVFVNKSLARNNNFTVSSQKNVVFLDKNLKATKVKGGDTFSLSILPGDLMIMQY